MALEWVKSYLINKKQFVFAHHCVFLYRLIRQKRTMISLLLMDTVAALERVAGNLQTAHLLSHTLDREALCRSTATPSEHRDADPSYMRRANFAYPGM